MTISIYRCWIMSNLAIVLSGHDDSCCRSHSLRNLLLLLKVKSEIQNGCLTLSSIVIYVHPSEFLFLYRAIAKHIYPNLSVTVTRNCGSLSSYDQVLGCFSTVFHGVNHPAVRIYDPTLSSEHIQNSIGDVKVL